MTKSGYQSPRTPIGRPSTCEASQTPRYRGIIYYDMVLFDTGSIVTPSQFRTNIDSFLLSFFFSSNFFIRVIWRACVPRFHWLRTSTILGSSQVTITWKIPQDVKPGEYRIRHNAYYRYILDGLYPYYGVTDHFQVRLLMRRIKSTSVVRRVCNFVERSLNNKIKWEL